MAMRSWLSWVKPRLFLSYAREDAALATAAFDQLTPAGFEVYYDVEKTLIGERFHEVIQRELRQCDAVVALVSRASAASPWCQAELYYAHALEKPIAPLRLGSAAHAIDLIEPLRLLGQTIQYIAVPDAVDFPRAMDALLTQLRTARRRRRSRILSRATLTVAALALLVVGWHEGIRRLNDATHERERNAILQRVHDSRANLTREAVAQIASESVGDTSLASSLLLRTRDREVSDVERINSILVSNALLAPRQPDERWALRNVAWHRFDLRRAAFNDVTFMTGRMDDIVFHSVTFAGVSWNQGPSQKQEGLMLSNIQFDTCRFYSSWFRGTGGISVDFRNCRFRGAWVDVQGFGATRFRANLREPNNPVITDEIMLFENSVITRCVPSPDPHVLEIVPQGSEVEFDGAIFDSSRLRGTIRPEWFRNCTFEHCILPKSLTRESLIARGNTLEDCIWVDEPCDWV